MSTSGSILLATLSPTDSAPFAPPSSFPLSPLSYAMLLTHRWGIIGHQYGRYIHVHVQCKIHVYPQMKVCLNLGATCIKEI